VWGGEDKFSTARLELKRACGGHGYFMTAGKLSISDDREFE
jgi:hypothetical protein